MPAYCVPAKYNNSQGTKKRERQKKKKKKERKKEKHVPMHSFPPNKPAMRRKWVKFVQLKRADCTDIASQHEHCVLAILLSFTSPTSLGIRRGSLLSGLRSQQRSFVSTKEQQRQISQQGVELWPPPSPPLPPPTLAQLQPRPQWKREWDIWQREISWRFVLDFFFFFFTEA